MLYLVATPIGNLGDITLRALDVLRAADVIASEDTRKTGVLLRHFDIKKPQLAFHEHNEHQAGPRIIGLLRAGQSVAVVTDAGTPGISDPGQHLVEAAARAGHEVVAVPGPSAGAAALSISGLAAVPHLFLGFPPARGGARRQLFERYRDHPETIVYFEAPHRLAASLADAAAVFGARPASVAREMTKVHEEVLRGTLAELAERVAGITVRGEIVVVLAGS